MLSAGSEEEMTDLKAAYEKTSGCIDGIMNEIPHSTYEDETRFVETINKLIEEGQLKSLPKWTKGLKDRKAKQARKKKGENESREAEKLAEELGVWDEFYGSGKEGKRGSKKNKGQDKDMEKDEDSEAVLKALIQKRQKKFDGFLDSLAEKYGAVEEDSKGKRRKAEEDTVTANKAHHKRTRKR